MKNINFTQHKQPLAYRMVPRKLEEFVGQEHILAEGKMLRRMIEADRLSSIILFGPPGTGKTSLARVIAATTEIGFKQLNAVTSGVKDIKQVISDTQNLILTPQGRTVLFIDEIHRFNKAQQDALLPQVEDGTLILIGATTENPYFEVNKALISRSTVFQLKPLTKENITLIVERALTDPVYGYGGLDIEIESKAKEFISDLSNGDARIALNGLELAVLTTHPNQQGKIVIDLPTIKDCMQKRSPAFDKGGEAHYDTISAFIKSMRGSDPDATLFYLARALHGGEDIEFLARRIVICAAEDVGLANPQILSIAVAAYQATKMIGMPEARIILAEAAVLVATSPKSNTTYLGIDAALADVKNRRTGEIPYHLRNAPIDEMKKHGYSQGYKYAHDFPHHYVKMQFLPEQIKNNKYYQPSEQGYEAKIKSWLEFLESLE
ncbi:MAG: replication-associated recombination protein A [Saccharofermentanales bacterium]|jgi:putative ATPase